MALRITRGGVRLLQELLAEEAQIPEAREELMSAAPLLGMSREEMARHIAEGGIGLKPPGHIAHTVRRIEDHDYTDSRPTLELQR